ncbi:hypothetical protein [Micromonospora sp. NPDC048842]|uniref:hypothetical protein n=1 Tax=unclassified Micromonospora TaxID=2617518 RepID=UPI003410482A
MTATYTVDVFSSLDGFGTTSGNWGGYWGKQGPELLAHRLSVYGAEQRMVFGANTYRVFAQMLAASTEESEVRDAWVTEPAVRARRRSYSPRPTASPPRGRPRLRTSAPPAEPRRH